MADTPEKMPGVRPRADPGAAAPHLTAYCPSRRASSTSGASCRLPRKSSSGKQREAASSSSLQGPSQAVLRLGRGLAQLLLPPFAGTPADP